MGLVLIILKYNLNFYKGRSPGQDWVQKNLKLTWCIFQRKITNLGK